MKNSSDQIQTVKQSKAAIRNRRSRLAIRGRRWSFARARARSCIKTPKNASCEQKSSILPLSNPGQLMFLPVCVGDSKYGIQQNARSKSATLVVNFRTREEN